MSSLFCKGSIDTVVKMAANGTGIAVAIQNPAMAIEIAPVAAALKAKVDGGTDNAVMNGLIQQGITSLLGSVKANPIIMLEANAVLSALNFDSVTGKLPTISNPVIIELVDSFVAGLTAGTLKV
jgi:hypothetical protein